MKRGQISVFYIVGIILIIVIGIMTYVQYSATKKAKEISAEETTAFSEEAKKVSTLIESCIEQETKKAIELYGISQESINNYILNNLQDCADFSTFTDLNINAKDFESSIEVSDYAINVEVNWPITIKKNSKISNLNIFKYRFDLYKETELELDENGEVSEDTYLVSDDEKVSLLIKKGTKIILNNNPVDKITMQLVNCITVACFGTISYSLGPTNAVLDPPAIYTIKYNEVFLGDSIEEDLRISYFDESKGLWFTYDNQEVDTENNKIIAEVDHL